MASKSNEKDLGYLGEEFQKRLIHAFMVDSSFFRDLSSIIDQNMFTSVIMRTYVAIMKDYYEKYQICPSYTVMDMSIRERIHNKIELEQELAFNEELKTVTTESIDYVREVATRFFKQQNIVRIANEILRVVGSNGTDADKYDKCVTLLTDAINVGTGEDYGEGIYDNIEDTLSDEYRKPIPTGVDRLDEVLEGGLGLGEVGMIIGPTSFGKTSLTTSFASAAATCRCEYNNNQGFKVLQIVFEDKIKQIRRKHFSKITQVEARNLSKPDYIQMVREQIDRYEDKEMLAKNLKIVKFPSGEKTIDQIKNYINRLINLGFKPDLLILDYFECLKLSGDKSLSQWEQEGKTMRRIETMASDLNMAVWVPSQGSRDSINSELVTIDKGGGSIRKAQVAHIILSIARSTDDIANNRATIAILKNRAGCSGKIFNNAYFNNGTCTVNMDDVDEFENMVKFDQVREEDIRKIQKELLKQAKKNQKAAESP